MRPFKAFVSAIRGQLDDDAFRATLVLLVGLLLAGTLIYPVLEGWSMVDSLYFSVVTLATVGYGDIHPVTDLGKLFTVLYILAGVGVLVVFASRVVNVMVSQRSESGRQREARPGTSTAASDGPRPSGPTPADPPVDPPAA
jgi:voltage-gated potassium channel Kch